MSLMAGKCPECGVLVEASSPAELADIIVAHQCDPDLWLAQTTRKAGRIVYVGPTPLERELERTTRALRAAWLIVTVEAIALIVNAVLWIVAR